MSEEEDKPNLSANNSTVLIVEDNEDIADILKQHLSEKYDVVHAFNGLEALEMIRAMKRVPCRVFLDLMMPVMDGWEFLKRVEAEGLLPGVSIVIVTAAHSSRIPKNITFLSKPFSFEAIENFCLESCSVKAEVPTA